MSAFGSDQSRLEGKGRADTSVVALNVNHINQVLNLPCHRQEAFTD